MMRRFVNLIAGICLATAKAALFFGLRKERDAWRWTAGLNLRGEAGRFSLAVFGLKDCAAESEGGSSSRLFIAKKLRRFLSTEPPARVAVENKPCFSRGISLTRTDVILAGFSRDGVLLDMEPVLDPDGGPAPERGLQEAVHRSLLGAANATRELDACKRAGAILKQIRSRHPSREAAAYAERLLQGCFVSFEESDGSDGRFLPPDPLVYRHPGTGLLFFTIRRQENGTADFWMQAHHAPVDGAPMQELLARLARHFGGCEPVRFPSPRHAPPIGIPCRPAGDRTLAMWHGFFDFQGILEQRRILNASLPQKAGLGALFIWNLAQQTGFRDLTFSLVVDAPPKAGADRCVDFLVIRPADFFDPAAPMGGFSHYARSFFARLQEARVRRSRASRTLRTTALLPGCVARQAMRLNVRVRRKAFGDLCVSILKETAVFLAPMGEAGFEHGLIAIGQIDLPCEGAGTAGSVSIKGEPAMIKNYPEAVRRALRGEAGG
jgi:hypothetical protein